jgi:hypothetical protein
MVMEERGRGIGFVYEIIFYHREHRVAQRITDQGTNQFLRVFFCVPCEVCG